MSSLLNCGRLIVACLIIVFATNAAAQDAVYDIDALNAGLGPAPETLDRSSPRSSVEALLDLAAAGDFETAAHLLNLALRSEPQHGAIGPELAEQLYTVVDRKVVINWGLLLDRPDALDARATSDSAVAGQARRSILLSVFTIDGRPYPIYLDRVQVEGEPAVWVFSERTVANIETLYETFGPSDMERTLPDWARQDAFWNLMWWEVILLPVMLLLAGIAGTVTHKTLTRIAHAADREPVTRIMRASRLPAVLFVTTSVVAIVSRAFVFSGPITTLIGPAIAIGYVLAVLILVVNVVDRIIDQLVELDSADLKQIDQGGMREIATKVSLARRMLIIVIVLAGLGIVLSQAGAFRTFGFSLLASAGAVTLVLGFAAREVLANIMSSMQIALNQSARIGDKVVYKGHICNVERINFTYVLLRVWTGVRLVVPVTEFVSETFENWTIKEPEMMRLIDIHVAHNASVGKLRDLFFEVLDELDGEDVGSEEDHKVVVTKHDVFGQTVTFCLSCSNPNTSWGLSCYVRERLIAGMKALEQDGASVFPDVSPAEGV